MKNNMNTKTMNTGMNTNNAIETKEEITMKTNKTNKTRRMNKVFAGALAALMMMTTVSGLAASADGTANIGTTDYTFTDLGKPGTLTDDEIAEFVKNGIKDMTLEQALDYWTACEKDPRAIYGSDVLTPEELKKAETELKDIVRQLSAKALSKAISAALKAGYGAGMSYTDGAVEKSVNWLLGVKSGPNAEDVMIHLDNKTAELVSAMQVESQHTIHSLRDMTAAMTIGAKLNEFDSAATTKTLEIKDIYTTAKNLKNYPTENDRLTATAALIGNLENYRKSDIAGKEQNAYTLITKPGNSIDPEGRSVMQVAYFMGKNDSVFKGEAIDRSAPYVRGIVNNYVRNALVMINLLDAQTKVSHFTQEEIDALSPEARKKYDMICSHADDAAEFQKELIMKLADPKTGILATAENYLDQTDRTVYIGKDGKSFVELSPEFKHVKSSYLVTEPGKYTGCVDFYTSRYNALYEASGLTAAQVKEICVHGAEACGELAPGKNNLRGYLEAVGFKFNDSLYTSHRADGTMFAIEKYCDWSRSWWSDGWIGLTAFRIDCRNTSVHKAGFIWGHTTTMYYELTNERGEAFDFLFFQKA